MNNNANERIITTHESYGTIQFFKGQCSTRTLFGSSIKHNDIILCRISNAELQRYLNKDWIHPISTVLEFEMSQTQFAEMLTNMNSSGAPITFKLKPIGELKRCEDPPFESVFMKHSNEFNEHLKTTNEKTENLIKELTKVLSESKIKKADKETLISLAENILTEINSNSNYQLKAFHEQMNKTMTECKNEIDAIIKNTNIKNAPKLIE